MRTFHLTGLFLVLCCLASACTLQMKRDTGEKSPQSQVSLDESANDTGRVGNSFGSGDVLMIRVYASKELTGTYQVGPRGLIIFPFIGSIDVRRMSSFELAEYIEKKLRDGYIRDPQVVVSHSEYVSKMVYVLGQVKKPRQIEIKKRTSILEAVAIAGGFTKLADRSNVVVRRMDAAGKETKFVLNVDAMIDGSSSIFMLYPGDVVFVKERFF